MGLLSITETKEKLTEFLKQDDHAAAENLLHEQRALATQAIIMLQKEMKTTPFEVGQKIAEQIVQLEDHRRCIVEMIGDVQLMERVAQATQSPGIAMRNLPNMAHVEEVEYYQKILDPANKDARVLAMEAATELLQHHLHQIAVLRSQYELANDPEDVVVLASRLADAELAAERIEESVEALEAMLCEAGIWTDEDRRKHAKKPIAPAVARKVAIAKQKVQEAAEVRKARAHVERLEKQLAEAQALMVFCDKEKARVHLKRNFPRTWASDLPGLIASATQAKEQASHIARDLKNWKRRLALLTGEKN